MERFSAFFSGGWGSPPPLSRIPLFTEPQKSWERRKHTHAVILPLFPPYNLRSAFFSELPSFLPSPLPYPTRYRVLWGNYNLVAVLQPRAFINLTNDKESQSCSALSYLVRSRLDENLSVPANKLNDFNWGIETARIHQFLSE